MLVVYRSPEADFNTNNINQISTTRWHSDVSYELQPPGVTSFFLFSQSKVPAFEMLPDIPHYSHFISSSPYRRRHTVCLNRSCT